MEKYQVGVILTLLCISVAALMIPAIAWAVRRVPGKTSHTTRKVSTVSRMLVFSAYLIVSVWCLRYAVGYFSIVSAQGDGVRLTLFEEIFNSIAHTLQSFSMDEDYTTYILDGKQMLTTLFPESPWLAGTYGAYTSVLNVTAIIAGGAILFELLASIFPQLKLTLSHLAVWKEKYYFSELNHASLALAKSISACNVSLLKKPVLIFADAYVDDENEKSSEKLLEAKALGAICVRDDLAHIRKNKVGMRKFFLIDEAEPANLQTLVKLSGKNCSRYLKNAEVFLFVNDDIYTQVEKQVRDKLIGDPAFDESELPIVVPVQSYRNLITNLLTDVPLYEPLIGKEKNSDGNHDLTVTILGTGNIGTEMFLNTYWMGQILNCDLKIRVVSQESEEDFWGKIDYINPEIKHTTIEGDPVLQINRKGDMAKVYCQVEYLQCDVKSSRFISLLTDEHNHILDTDYFLVALGSDADNISAANTVKKYVGQYHIHMGKPIKTVINYVVYDPEQADSLNRTKYLSYVGGSVDVYMQAVGSLRDVYSVENVFMGKHETMAKKAYDAYSTIQGKEKRADAYKKRMQDDYKHWADLARAMHVKYKVFSMGMIQDSLFDYPDKPEVHSEKMEQAYNRCMEVVTGRIPHETKVHLELLHKMAWLEHRRWNAFTRVKGFRCTKDYDVYAAAGVKGSYKQMELKLHPCLIECDQKGIRTAISPIGVVDEDKVLTCEDHTDFDLLDDLSYDLHQKDFNSYDFKQFDYPISTIRE